MSVYRHILVPTDLSSYSERAAIRAKELATAFDARLSLLHVVDVPLGYVAVELPETYGSEKWLLERAGQQLKMWAESLDLTDAERWVRSGVPRRVVIDLAAKERVDLIVIGTSSSDILKRIIGSTTAGILQHAPCDVLSVQADANRQQ